MGDVLRVLAATELPARRACHSKVFIDIGENVHIHHRDFRQVFSVPEFIEYTDVLARMSASVRQYLHDNPEYREGGYPTLLWMGLGRMHMITASPQPQESAYFANRLEIELERPRMETEVHVHWRDLRLDIDREQLRIAAEAFAGAVEALTAFEQSEGYTPKRPRNLAEVVAFHESRPVHPEPGPGHYLRMTESRRSLIVPETTPVLRARAPARPGSTLVALHWAWDRARLRHIRDVMRQEEGVAIRVVWDDTDGLWRAIEGSHRLWVAHEANEVVDLLEVAGTYRFFNAWPHGRVVSAREVIDDWKGRGPDRPHGHSRPAEYRLIEEP